MAFLINRYMSRYRRTITGTFHTHQCFCSIRSFSKEKTQKIAREIKSETQDERSKARTAFNYIAASAIAIAGMGFAAVPLFDAFCRTTNYAGTLNINLSRDRPKNMKKVEDVEFMIYFNADKNAYLQWKFKPLQPEIKVAPGETVLAFYTAENPTDKPISGVSTYNVVPYEAARYFNKIQCFCFDEQRLNPHEQVDMPVFFYIDPDIMDDPYLFGVKNITLSYTFFEAIEGLDLPFMSSFVDED